MHQKYTLPSFLQLTVETLLEVTLLGALVEGALGVLVLDVDEGAPLHEHVGHLVVAPEARVVERRVAVLVDEVHVGLVLQELGGETGIGSEIWWFWRG